MKVLFVCSYYFKHSQTGAGTQVRETYNYLVSLGHQVTQIFVKHFPVVFETQSGDVLSRDAIINLLGTHDVAHLIHCSRMMARIWRDYNKESCIPTVGSTIFWAGKERIQMALKTYPLGIEVIRVVSVFARSLFKWYNNFLGIDCFLPNSNAEAKVVDQHFKRDKQSIIMPAPNGFVIPDSDFIGQDRHPDIPFNEYIVVPGIFANRKNQLGIIKALRASDIPVVFMGGTCEEHGKINKYYRHCRELATSNMLFLGYVDSATRQYWSVLSHARCACLASDCETPGIAMIEAAYAGARPIITKFGGTSEYFGFDAEYLDPRDELSIREAVTRAWLRGRLATSEALAYGRYTWEYCAKLTTQAYELTVKRRKAGGLNEI